MGWQDRQYKRQGEAAAFPFIQWVNNGGALEPRNADGVGGFAQPLAQAQILGAHIPGQVHALHHRGGDATDVVFTTELAAAVLATRFCWIKDGAMRADYAPGARGKLQALCLVRDADGDVMGPTMLTFSGLAGRQFSQALDAHREAVRQATAGKAPAYAFFGVYRSGTVQMVGNGKKSPITTIDYGGSEVFDPDTAFVGDGALNGVDWDRVDEWRTAWDGGANNGSNGNGAPRTNRQNASKRSKASGASDDGRVSAKQWKRIRGSLAQLGYATKEEQDGAIRKAGYDPAALTATHAQALMARLAAALE